MKFLPTFKGRVAFIYAFAVFLFIFALILGICVGSVYISPVRAIGALFGASSGTAEGNIIHYVRLPRTLGSLFCGGALALAGAVIQGVLGNRLASPSIIGVNAGAGLFVSAACACGIFGGWRLSLCAFIGALLSVFAVSLGAKKWGASHGTVVLMGVALNALLGAFTDAIITVFPDVSILSSDFRIGGFSGVTYAKLIPASVIIVISALLLFTFSSELDVLSLGDENARGLGLNTGVMRALFLIFSALLAGAAVSVCGTLSFVGLLVPHAVRRIRGGAAKHLLPLCFLLGGGFVSVCDTLSRSIFSPYEIPVGIIMSFLGAPFFFFILIRRRGGHDNA
ncbi:MAG: iron ABC transporter permease [Clostridia bacterium]|nr:iron ABC transporter permease [Clostridia bacterium]